MIKPDKFTTARSAVAEKVKESAVSVLPIVLIVTLLCLGIAPTKPELLLCFFIGALMIVLGMGLFSLGAEQFQAFYSLLSEEFRSYFDLMMIPGLIGEKMTAAEYEQLLSSMYGPTFAKDVVSGTLEISLSSPDGKKTLKDTISLGDILTLSETKTWKISW